ncbi:MAG: CDP-alcohol phosphatidyltransferase family protein [Clostridia bacterium]|nr:CDP-alcohol phosphatidyltransferase family protein [Clostridia bacterium]MBR0302450.1 CDP-alcohol phosphatidyltransferase family protein [Clostridia bacterium]
MANIITVVRIICSIGMLFVPVFSPAFYVLYLTAGVSDMVDGTVARKTGSASDFGSKLDTAADLILVAVCLVKMIPVLNFELWMFISGGIILIIKMINIISGFVVLKKLVTVHSVMNKIAGALLFILPLTVRIIDFRYGAAIVCVVAAVAAVQEGHYIRTGRSE